MSTNEPPSSGQPNSPTNDLPSYGSAPPPPGGSYPPPPPGGDQPPSAPGGYGEPGGYGAPAEGNKKALWSMILGIVSLICFGIITGTAAIVLSMQAKNEIAASGGRQTGSGQATAGMVLGIIGIVFSVIGIVYVLSR